MTRQGSGIRACAAELAEHQYRYHVLRLTNTTR